MLDIGGNRVVGQEKVRSEIAKIIQSDRVGQAYLFTGPPGVGKKALALAFAEAINGVENLSNLGDLKTSPKSSWYVHPDIRLFIPRPKDYNHDDFAKRIALLAEDPYSIVDYANRPSVDDDSETKNRNAFYHIEYMRDEIRKAASLKPNEGKRNIIIISNIEKMSTQVSNAFLKTLEEPAPNLMFIITTDNFGSLLPTITSRCQILRCTGLSKDDIKNGLMQKDQYPENDAEFLARIAGGNYASTRFYDLATLKQNRKEVIEFLRMSYRMDATEIIKLSAKWQNAFNVEGVIGILNMLEVFLRDIKVFSETRSLDFVTNADQGEVIEKFVTSMQQARIEEMIDEVNNLRAMVYQNVQIRYAFTSLAIRFGHLMRGVDTPIPSSEPWNHLPASA
jgi:DNA polymerase III subunit delta'